MEGKVTIWWHFLLGKKSITSAKKEIVEKGAKNLFFYPQNF